MIENSTYFALMSEFGTAEIELELLCEKYFGLSFVYAKREATLQRLPVPVHRGGTQKSPWLVNAADLAEHLEQRREKARRDWERIAGDSV